MHWNLLALSALISHVLAHTGPRSEGVANSRPCDALTLAGLGDMVVFPGSPPYNQSVSTYYSSENRRLRPWCILQPRSTTNVSVALKALKDTRDGGWDIAVRSGGHSDFDNNAVDNGVTIDLSFFDDVEVTIGCSSKWSGSSTLTKSVARIRPAARWGDVMTTLEPHNLGVTGGRSGHVGVGGLLISGGASYHTQLWGLSCDSVVGYEVVLADGSVVEASERENVDLFVALKGGGSNLGVVTRFDMRTFTTSPQGAYGGLVFAPWNELDALNAQFVTYAASSSGSADHEFMVYRNDGGNFSVMAMLVSTDGHRNAQTFAPFNDITLTQDARALQPLSNISSSIADTGGSHYIPFSLILQATAGIMRKATEIFEALSQGLLRQGVPVSVNFIFQPMPKSPLGKRPQNILGHAENLPADSILFEARGTLAAADAKWGDTVYTEMAKAVEELRLYSASQSGHSTYLYMNYANPEQDVLGSYGHKNVEFLKATAAKYDPDGIFQYRIAGGWKVSDL